MKYQIKDGPVDAGKQSSYLTRLKQITVLSFLLPGKSATCAEVPLRAQIGQMLLFGFKGTELKKSDFIVQAILAQQIGGVVLFDYDLPTHCYGRNIKNSLQLQKLTQQLQSYTQQAAQNNRNTLYPLLIGLDYEGGKVNRLNGEGFPPTLSAAVIGQGSYQQAKQQAEQMALTLKKNGINFNFAPVIDVNVNPDNPIIGKKERSFSKDPSKVTAYAAIFSKAYQQQGIICSYKHFPGHGSSTRDTHLGLVDVSKTWQSYELAPYRSLLKRFYACPTVMVAHVVNRTLDKQGYPAILSTPMITKLLREDLRFNGVVITDDMQMKAITDHYGLAEAVRMTINAGADILVFSNQEVSTPQNPKTIIDLIYNDVKAGTISRERITQSYQRIMRLKASLAAASNADKDKTSYLLGPKL